MRARLVAEVDPIELGGDPLDNAAHACVRCIDLTEVENLSFPAGFRNRHGIPLLRNIDSDECFVSGQPITSGLKFQGMSISISDAGQP